tara:strand:- start:807 stop:1295 length:489 start_codon:yes stop_codon:yes gene_type:complete
MIFDNFFFNYSIVKENSFYRTNIGYNFSKYYFILVYFFFYSSKEEDVNLMFVPKSFFLMTEYANFQYYLNLVYDLMYINHDAVYLSNHQIYSSNINFSDTSKLFLHFLDFNYMYYNYEKDSYKFYFNKQKARKNKFLRASALIGFKFHCVGRFTRKQRASSV